MLAAERVFLPAHQRLRPKGDLLMRKVFASGAILSSDLRHGIYTGRASSTFSTR